MTEANLELTFRGQPELKDAILARLDEHAKLDTLVAGHYAFAERANGDYKLEGCALGCTLFPTRIDEHVVEEWRTYPWPEAYEAPDFIEACRLRGENPLDVWRGRGLHSWAGVVAYAYSLPEWLTNAEEDLFEGIEDPEHREWRQSWPRRLIAAIPVGVPLHSLVDAEEAYGAEGDKSWVNLDEWYMAQGEAILTALGKIEVPA